MLRVFDPIPATVTSQVGCAALVAADRMGVFRTTDVHAVLAAAGYASSDRTVRRYVRQMEADRLIQPFGRGPAGIWIITATGHRWANKVWLGDPVPAWEYRPRTFSTHRRHLNELFARLTGMLDGVPVLGLWRTHGRAAVGTYDVAYDPDARLDLEHVRLWIEMDRITVRPYRLEAKMARLREVLAFRQLAVSGYRRMLWILERRSPARKAQVTELLCKWLDGMLEAPPDPGMAGIAPDSAFAGAAPAFEVWMGTVEEVLARLEEEWPFWAARPGAVRPHMLAADRVRAALARAGYAAAVAEAQPPATPWRVPVLEVESRRPRLLVVDGRHSGTLPAWAAMLERWAAAMPGRAYGLVLLAEADDAIFLAGRRVLWTTPALLDTEAGVRVAPQGPDKEGLFVEWTRVVGPARRGAGQRRLAGPGQGWFGFR